MQYDDASLLPDDPIELKAIILTLSKANADLQKSHAEIQAKLDKTITELQRLSNLFEKFFNKSSQKLLQEKEKRDAEKQEAAQTPENAEPEKPKGKRGEKGGGGRNPLLYGGVYVQMDATGVKYLDPEIKGKAGQGTIWGYNGDITVPYVLYDFQTNGTRAGPAMFLKGYDKFVQCDATHSQGPCMIYQVDGKER